MIFFIIIILPQAMLKPYECVSNLQLFEHYILAIKSFVDKRMWIQ